jgi:hypothetical protein
MTDSEKLRLLANWLDKEYPNNNDEVQRDLREIASKIEKMQEELTYFKTWRFY